MATKRVYCKCEGGGGGVEAARYQSRKKNANEGRWFSSCKERKCGFFEWDADKTDVDEAMYHVGEGQRRRKVGETGEMVKIPQSMAKYALWDIPAHADTCCTCGAALGGASWRVTVDDSAVIGGDLTVCQRCGGDGEESVLSLGTMEALGTTFTVTDVVKVSAE